MKKNFIFLIFILSIICLCGCKVNNHPYADSILYKKKMVCDGDSIMESRMEGPSANGGGWAKIIADKFNMKLQNNAKSGGTLAYYKGKHCISQSVKKLDKDADYVIFDGGINDFCIDNKGIPVGVISNSFEFIEDTNTVIGSLEKMCYELKRKFPKSKIGYVFNHKIFYDNRKFQVTWLEYKQLIKDTLDKWNIKYIDLEEQIPYLNYDEELKKLYTCNGDGWHPNEEGYKKFYCDKIEKWLETL